jgi:APA family basic amino acid/polyamine antiporter
MATTATAPQQLTRGLGLLDATMIVVGSMIGSGIFVVSATSAQLVGAPGWLMAAWLLASVLTITGSICCAELAGMYPHAGGVYVFFRNAYHPVVGFVFGWAMLLVIQTATIAAVAIAFAKFLGVLAPGVAGDNYLVAPIPFGSYALSLSTQQLVGVAVVLALTWANTRGLRTGKLIQNTFTLTKTAALFGLIVLGLLLGWNSNAAAFTSSWWNPWANGWKPPEGELPEGLLALGGGVVLVFLLGKAMTGPLFAQTAWNNVTFTGSEVTNPEKNLPRALILGCALVVALYLLANVAYLVTLPFDAIANAKEKRVATATLQAIFGAPAAVVMAVLIMISTFGCINGLVLAGARIYYALAHDGLFFRPIAEVNRHHVPALALWIQGLWSALLILPRTVSVNVESGKVSHGDVYDQLLNFLVPTDALFYVLMVVAVVVLRWKAPDVPRPYRTWGYPLTPLVYLALATVVIGLLIYLSPETSGIGFLIACSGIPVYFLWAWRGTTPQNSRQSAPPSGSD